MKCKTLFFPLPLYFFHLLSYSVLFFSQSLVKFMHLERMIAIQPDNVITLAHWQPTAVDKLSHLMYIDRLESVSLSYCTSEVFITDIKDVSDVQ